MAIIIKDDFVDTDNTELSSHTISPTNTAGASWISGVVAIFGSPTGVSIVSNRANVSGGSSTRVAGKVLESGVSDCELSGVFGYIDNSVGGTGFVFRYADSSNYWYADIAKISGVTRLVEVASGITTVRATGGIFIAGSADRTLTLSLNGSEIELTSAYGVVSFSSSFNQTATKHGIAVNSVPTNADSFQVDDLAATGTIQTRRRRSLAGYGL